MAVIFPRWLNHLPTAVALGAPVGLAAAVGAVWYWFSPSYTDVGYMPEQPVPFSHKLHAGDLGVDCRYCHDTVERAAVAAIPPASTCMNCHKVVRFDSPKLQLVRDAFADEGKPVQWSRVHMLPDYAFFDHSPHLAAGVGCASCHGRIDQMDEVFQREPLSMGWCLQCHRDPEPHLRPLDRVTDMTWSENDAADYDATTDPARKRQPAPPEHCSACHR